MKQPFQGPSGADLDILRVILGDPDTCGCRTELVTGQYGPGDNKNHMCPTGKASVREISSDVSSDSRSDSRAVSYSFACFGKSGLKTEKMHGSLGHK